MRLPLLLVSSSLLLAGVDGHGAVVWPPNWQDGQAIPLDERSLRIAFLVIIFSKSSLSLSFKQSK